MSKKMFNLKFTEANFPYDKINPFDIYIKPSKKSWNDFTYKIHCEYITRTADKTLYHGNVLVGFIDILSKSGSAGLGNLLNHNVHKTNESEYFTLLSSIQEYRTLISNLGVKNANNFLHTINDLVYLKKNTKKSNLYSGAVDSKVFQLAFMRNSEPFYAFNNAGSLLDGLNLEALGKISSSLNLNFKLDAFDNMHEIKFRFKTKGLIPKRINVLIGKNGLGKSQALNHFVKAALQQRSYIDTLIDPNNINKRPMISRLLAIGTPGETSNTFPSDKIKNPKLYYKRLILTRGGKTSSSLGVGKSLVELARSKESIGGNSRWKLFIKAIHKCIPIDDLVIERKNTNDEYKYVNVVDLKSGWNEQIRLEIWSHIEQGAEPKIKYKEGYHELSSGQLSFLKFALLTCLTIENGSIVLFDEPETHLHPNLISDFVALLDNLLEKTGSYSIIATHSTYFVREVTRSQVHIFKSDDTNSVSIQPPRLKTFGADVGAISHFVFDEDIENVLSEKIYKYAKEKDLSFLEVKNKYGDDLSSEILMQVKRRMEEKL